MLDKEKTLIRGFVEVFDRERGTTLEFRKARNEALRKTGTMRRVWGTSSVVEACQNINVYLEERAQFIWAKAKEVTTATNVPATSSLSSDLRAILAEYMDPVIKSAHKEFEEIRASGNVASGYTAEAINASKNIVLKIGAEIDLFCAQYAMNQNDNAQRHSHIVYNFHGANARVNIDSVDLSINVANSDKIFAELRKVIEASITDKNVRTDLLEKSRELESAVGKPSYKQRYLDFVTAAANHMTLLGPILPALTKFLT